MPCITVLSPAIIWSNCYILEVDPSQLEGSKVSFIADKQARQISTPVTSNIVHQALQVLPTLLCAATPDVCHSSSSSPLPLSSYRAAALGLWIIFLPTSINILPTFQTFWSDGVHFAKKVVHFAHFQYQARKRGVLGWGWGCFVYVHIPERGLRRLSKEQGLLVVFWAKWDPIWAKWDPSGKFVLKVGKSALELGGGNSIIWWVKFVSSLKQIWSWIQIHSRLMNSTKNSFVGIQPWFHDILHITEFMDVVITWIHIWFHIYEFSSLNSWTNSYIWILIWFDYIFHDHDFISEFKSWIQIRFHDHEFICYFSWAKNSDKFSCIWKI